MNIHQRPESLPGTSLPVPNTTWVVAIDSTQPIQHVHTPGHVERLSCDVSYDGIALGYLELPVFDGFVSRYVIEDAIAAKFFWEILGRYFRETIYSCVTSAQWNGDLQWSRDGGVLGVYNGDRNDPAFHDALGWTVFLQELWGLSSWSVAQFYENCPPFRSGPPRKGIATERVELSDPIRPISLTDRELQLLISVGGSPLGVAYPQSEAAELSAAELVALVTSYGNLELCRAVTREALIGRPCDLTTLRERLMASAAEKAHSPAHQNTDDCWPFDLAQAIPSGSSAIFMPHYSAPVGTSASRRAHLPRALLNQAALRSQQRDARILRGGNGQNPILVYAPELLPEVDTQSQTAKEREVAIRGVQAPALYSGRAYWEGLFARKPDPWRYTNTYEQDKYEQTLSLVPEGVSTALELACAEGLFTERLASRVRNLIASDVSQVALDRAALRCSRQANVRFARVDMVHDSLPADLDLIVCSEVLYYIGGWDALRAVAGKIEQALKPCGYVLTAHANQVVDEPDKPGFDWGVPFGAAGIAKVFASVAALKLQREIQTPLYRIQLYRKTDDDLVAEKVEKEVSLPLPSHIADMVYWHGTTSAPSALPPLAVTRRLPILMYHRVAPEGCASLARYRVHPEEFERQMLYLRDAGYYSVGFDEWRLACEAKKPLPGRAVLITFDDGYTDFREFAWPILKQYGFSAFVFLVAGQIGGTNTWDAGEEELALLSPHEILQLQADGVQFGSHGYSHQQLMQLSPVEIAREHLESRNRLEGLLGKQVGCVSYPYGSADDIVQHLAGACGYTYGVTTRMAACTFRDSLLALPRIEVTGGDSLETFVAKVTDEN